MAGYAIIGPDERQRPAIERVITVTVIDTSDLVGIVAAVTRMGEYRMSNV